MNSPPTGDPGPPDQSRRSSRPSIELAAAVDDRRNPTTLTVYPKHGRDRTTRWLTIEIDWVLGLDEMV